MTKFVLSSSALAIVLAVPAVALAQSAPNGGGSSCPPGSWFCATPPQEQATPAGPLQPLPEPEAQPARPSGGVTYAPAPQAAPPPPVVVYQPPPPVMVVRPESPPPYEYVPPHREISRAREWGLNLHLDWASIGRGSQGNASMGGLGAALRYKPTRYFGIEGGLDFVGGHGYQGDLRNETGLTFNGLLFLNPKSRAQVYLLAGFGWAWAHSRTDPAFADPSTQTYDYNYSYFGGQAGVGLELRLTRVLAFNIDLRGFVRSRTDQLAQTQPEFGPDQYGRTTNTSGGGLLTGGMTLYF
ncbi:MAG TPA: outer membrane beta-barrel protein [Polyangiaceae bacterium]